MKKIYSNYNTIGRVYARIFGESLTQQQFADEVDINNIMKKYERTGLITHVNSIQASYGDFSNVEDYHASMQKIVNAETAFMQLPADLRLRFSNKPSELLKFLSDEKNVDEAIKLGLMEKPASPPISEVKEPEATPPVTAEE